VVYVERKDVPDGEFVQLLERTRQRCLGPLRQLDPTNPQLSTAFQDLAFDGMTQAAIGSPCEGTIRLTGPHGFPDIVANGYHGAEVKVTSGDHWTSTGNSIFEGTRAGEVTNIYMFFGKRGGNSDIRYRRYQDCLAGIGVTHSPRYKIDMDCPPRQSIFDQMHTSYDEIRTQPDRLMAAVRQHYRGRKNAPILWWMDTHAEERVVTPSIQRFSSLTAEEQEHFTVEAMALFPEVFGRSTVKFDRPVAFMIQHYNAVCSNIRDHFTAGGRASILIHGRIQCVEHILGLLDRLAGQVVSYLSATHQSILEDSWGTTLQIPNVVTAWANFADDHAASKGGRVALPSDILRERGLL
jgi:hypothetical protein